MGRLEKIIADNIEILISHASTLSELNLISETISDYEEVYHINLEKYKTRVSDLKVIYFKKW